MSQPKWPGILAAIMLAAGLSITAVLVLRPGLTPYLAVDELAARADDLRGRRVRLAGIVATVPQRNGPNAPARFQVGTRGASLTVLCDGTVPPELEPGTDVLLDGRLGEDDTFHAHRLLTRCASRYSDKLHQQDDSPRPAPEVNR